MNFAQKLASTTKANQKPKKSNPIDQFERKVKWGSHQYVRYVKERCEELNKQGYGSVGITIDRTVDDYGMDEGRNSCYSAAFVTSLLVKEGFKFLSETREGVYYSHYDAFSDVLVWEPNSPKAPKSEEIGMCWK